MLALLISSKELNIGHSVIRAALASSEKELARLDRTVGLMYFGINIGDKEHLLSNRREVSRCVGQLRSCLRSLECCERRDGDRLLVIGRVKTLARLQEACQSYG
jgi:hypothetical protein